MIVREVFTRKKRLGYGWKHLYVVLLRVASLAFGFFPRLLAQRSSLLPSLPSFQCLFPPRVCESEHSCGGEDTQRLIRGMFRIAVRPFWCDLDCEGLVLPICCVRALVVHDDHQPDWSYTNVKRLLVEQGCAVGISWTLVRKTCRGFNLFGLKDYSSCNKYRIRQHCNWLVLRSDCSLNILTFPIL